ncbi:pro-resilin-like [Macrobrachium rosenbergii]|uniref:pro-resilin-like n=1 Tax=Macrobrachium rosenbergii TaxID=79674 RepID=UPI0034D40193
MILENDTMFGRGAFLVLLARTATLDRLLLQKALFLAAILAVAAAESPRSYGPPPPPSQSYGTPNGFNNGNGRFPPARYDFEYEVKDRPSGNDFGHQESRRGDNTDGSYSVLLPDGRFQKVTYEVNGDSGFLAEVTYEEKLGTQDLRLQFLMDTKHPGPPPMINVISC